MPSPDSALVPRPTVVGDWVCMHPRGWLPENVCFKCGGDDRIARRPIRARCTEGAGYNTIQTTTATLFMPLCARCDWLRKNAALLMTLSVLIGWIGLPMLGVMAMETIGIGLMLLATLGGPIAGLALPVVFYRRSTFNLGDIDERGVVEISWVHPAARAEIEASQG